VGVRSVKGIMMRVDDRSRHISISQSLATSRLTSLLTALLDSVGSDLNDSPIDKVDSEEVMLTNVSRLFDGSFLF
jgi:hypothetical protein